VQEQEIFLLFKGTLTEVVKNNGNLLIGNKGETLQFSRDQGLILYKRQQYLVHL